MPSAGSRHGLGSNTGSRPESIPGDKVLLVPHRTVPACWSPVQSQRAQGELPRLPRYCRLLSWRLQGERPGGLLVRQDRGRPLAPCVCGVPRRLLRGRHRRTVGAGMSSEPPRDPVRPVRRRPQRGPRGGGVRARRRVHRRLTLAGAGGLCGGTGLRAPGRVAAGQPPPAVEVDHLLYADRAAGLLPGQRAFSGPRWRSLRSTRASSAST